MPSLSKKANTGNLTTHQPASWRTKLLVSTWWKKLWQLQHPCETCYIRQHVLLHLWVSFIQKKRKLTPYAMLSGWLEITWQTHNTSATVGSGVRQILLILSTLYRQRSAVLWMTEIEEWSDIIYCWKGEMRMWQSRMWEAEYILSQVTCFPGHQLFESCQPWCSSN